MDTLMNLLEINTDYLHGIGITNEDLLGNDDYDSDLQDDRELEELNEKEKRPKHPTKISKLEIKPLFKDDSSYAEAPNAYLFKPPFSLLLVAVRGAGKTTFMGNILIPYKDYFDTIYVFSPTAKLDISFRKIVELLDINKKNIFNKYSESKLKKIMKMVKKKNKNVPQNKKHRTLIIFEDIIDDLPKGINKSVINKLAMNCRHYNISFVMLSQYFKKIPPVVRTNTSCWALWSIENTAERKKIVDELSGSIGKSHFEYLYDEVTAEPYSALTINYQNQHPYKFTKNFNETIIDL